MTIQEVQTTQQARTFLAVHVDLNRHEHGFIRPLDKDVEQVFDPEKNKSFRQGKACRWLLLDENGKAVGRIAAFTNRKYKNKGDQQATGCFGFFDCRNKPEEAALLLHTARIWLEKMGMQAMDGPVNFGERDRFWGLLVDGFEAPPYGMNFNPPYYESLLTSAGFRPFYNQICYRRPVQDALPQRFLDVHKKLKETGIYRADRVRLGDWKRYARDFCTVYNKAWAKHEGNKEMPQEQAIKIFKAMKPIMDEDIAWFVYAQDEPVAMYLNIPDLNQIFRHFNGKLGWFEKLRLLWYLKRRTCTRFVGIIFGITPEHQGKGVDKFMVVEAAQVIQSRTRYQETELQWIGDFNPKMIQIAKELEFEQSRTLTVFRLLFDPEQPFYRHPILGSSS